MVEQRTGHPKVVGSIPASGMVFLSLHRTHNTFNGRLSIIKSVLNNYINNNICRRGSVVGRSKVPGGADNRAGRRTAA